MPGFLVALYWLWFAVSVVLLVRRRGARRAAARTDAPSPPSPAPDDVRARADAFAQRLTAGATAPASMPTRSLAPASTTAVATIGRDTTLLDVLAGLVVPAPFVPTAAAGRADAATVAFRADVDPASARARFAQALRELGATVDEALDGSLVARNAVGAVRVDVVTVAAGTDAAAAYPGASPGSTVVAFRLVSR